MKGPGRVPSGALVGSGGGGERSGGARSGTARGGREPGRQGLPLASRKLWGRPRLAFGGPAGARAPGNIDPHREGHQLSRGKGTLSPIPLRSVEGALFAPAGNNSLHEECARGAAAGPTPGSPGAALDKAAQAVRSPLPLRRGRGKGPLNPAHTSQAGWNEELPAGVWRAGPGTPPPKVCLLAALSGQVFLLLAYTLCPSSNSLYCERGKNSQICQRGISECWVLLLSSQWVLHEE